MTLKINDPLVAQLIKSEGLYDESELIASEEMSYAIQLHAKSFVTSMLEDLIMRPAGESFYAPSLVWPERNDRDYDRG
jgi:hypothetical protein